MLQKAYEHLEIKQLWNPFKKTHLADTFIHGSDITP